MQNPLAKLCNLFYIAAMKKQKLSACMILSAVFAPMGVPAFAQTPISTSIHLSGSCVKCDLSNRIMPGLSLQGANFASSNFSHSNLSGAKLDNSNLVSASFHKAYLMQVEGEGVNLNYSVLSGATLSEASLRNSDFTGADLRKSDLGNSDFSGSNFTRARFSRADAMGAVFIDSIFTDAQLKRSDFTGADFTRVKFIRTKFGDAIVRDAIFNQANLIDADLSGVSGLDQEQIMTACGSKKTKLPEGLSLRICPKENEFIAESVSDKAILVKMSAQNRQLNRRANSKAVRNSVLQTRRATPSYSQEIKEAMELIDQSLRDLPMDSPTRKRLSQAREKLGKIPNQK